MNTSPKTFAVGETVTLTTDLDKLCQGEAPFAGKCGMVARVLPCDFYAVQFATGKPMSVHVDELTAKTHDFPACATYRGGKCTCD